MMKLHVYSLILLHLEENKVIDMDIYIEKEFLDNFDLDYNEKTASPSQLKLISIFKEYPELNIYMDFDFNDYKEVESYQDNNRTFSAITKIEPSRLNSFFSFLPRPFFYDFLILLLSFVFHLSLSFLV